MTGIAERLRDYCVDWTGEQIVNESTPRTEIYCGEIREAADAIDALLVATKTLLAFTKGTIERAGLTDTNGIVAKCEALIAQATGAKP